MPLISTLKVLPVFMPRLPFTVIVPGLRPGDVSPDTTIGSETEPMPERLLTVKLVGVLAPPETVEVLPSNEMLPSVAALWRS